MSAQSTSISFDQARIHDEDGKARIIARCPKYPVEVGLSRKTLNALFDTGAEICAISARVARSCNLMISQDMEGDQLSMTAANHGRTSILGFVFNCPIRIGSITTKVTLCVVEALTHDIILGMPFSMASSLSVSSYPSGRISLKIRSADGLAFASFDPVDEEIVLRPALSEASQHREHSANTPGN